jgi:signal transduction histidine kinase
VERPDRVIAAEEVRLPKFKDLCDAMVVAAPSGQVLLRHEGSLGESAWAALIPPGTGRLSPPLSRLVRAQWARRPEADAIFLKLGHRIVLARAQAQQVEEPQIVITLLDASRARDPFADLTTTEDEMAAERRRLARELHDLVGQRLATLVVNLDCDLRENQVDVERTRAYRDELRAVLSSVRHVHQDLRWTATQTGGLVGAVRRQVVPQLERVGCQVRLKIHGWPSRFPAEDSFQVLRMVQESTANVIRHAQATRTVIGLEGQDETALVSVTDNGIGFNPGGRLQSPSSIGLTGMRERARLIGGHFQVLSTPGLGTTVGLVVPPRA